MEKWKTTNSESRLDSRWVKVRRDSVDLPNGQHIDDFYLDPTEELDVLVVPLKKAVEMVMNNEICCNSSAHGILWVARKLEV